jgi:hypothetical protein
MALRKILTCTVCAVAVAAAGCADGTGQALTPTLPTLDANAANADGTRLKASAPQPLSPRSAVRITNLTPQLVLENGAGSFDSSAELTYVFELFEGTQLIAKSDPIPAGSPRTIWVVPANLLKQNKTYAWRAYAVYNGVNGSLSDGVSFRTPLPPPVDGPVACNGNNGIDIVRCVGRAYPKYLVSTAAGDGSLERRKHNMEFIRDRIIETGICQGLDLGRNFKRGTPVISHDFIVWRRPGHHDAGVDIATGYDDVNQPLRIKWQVFDADENYGHPYYAKYPPVDCTNLADPSAAALAEPE